MNSVCLYRCAKEGKSMLCVAKMQIALVPNQRKIKFNVVDTFILVSVFFLFFFSVLAFNNSIALTSLHPVSHSITSRYIRCHIPLLPVTSGVTFHYFPLHPVSSRTSSGLRIQFIQHSSPIDYLNILLDFIPTLLWIVQRHEFALHIDLDSLLYFLVG